MRVVQWSSWRRWAAIVFAAILSICQLCAAEPLRAAEPPAETIVVGKTYNNTPFEYRSRLLVERVKFRVYRLSYPSPITTSFASNNTVPADYYVPKQLRPGVKYPAVICLHILDGNEPLTELVCSVLASRGIPAISFKLPYYGSRGGTKGPQAMAADPKMFAGAIRQAGEDIRRTIDLLASRPEVNPERIGITGISLGGIIAASAAGAEPRLYRTGLILSGGDVLAIIRHAWETRPLSAMLRRLPAEERAEIEGQIAAADPLRFAPALRDRALAGRVMMLNAAEDEVIPHECTDKLAQALGIADRVTWFPGVGHYTIVAEMPRSLKMTADFFAQDLPKEEQATGPLGTEVPSPRASPLERCVGVVEQATAILSTEPQSRCCHVADIELSPLPYQARFVRGTQDRFLLRCRLPQVGEVAAGQGRFPWLMVNGKTVIVGTRHPVKKCNALCYVDSLNRTRLRVVKGVADSLAMAPHVLEPWICVSGGDAASPCALQIKNQPWSVSLKFGGDGRTPDSAALVSRLVGQSFVMGTLKFRQWQLNAPGSDDLFEPPADLPRQEVEQEDVLRVFAAAINFGVDQLDGGSPRLATGGATPMATLGVVARDPAGHGMVCRSQGKTILMVSGTPAEMGAAQGTLLREPARKMTERALYLVGGGDTIRSGQWFFDRMAEIERRTTPHIPARFFEEIDALGRAAGVSPRDARAANLFPERFHCSGVALRGKATQGGRVLHARVLDYMREIDLQQAAVLQVFMPEGRNAWMSVGYAGFVGTVTAMNERGVAIGEMGGRGEGHWDGMPMSLLLRDVMERAGTADEALAILRAAQRTCEYYYVLSDRSGTIRSLRCTPDEVLVLGPGQQHPELPQVPQDTVLISGGDRAKTLSRRITENYGRIDVTRLIEIIKRPVAMQSNLHDAIFAPETLEMWF
ncbi:MAG: C45 family autoproteolytic acyltransferase/hydrolase, partial [Thermoguttaceae bacterium]